jgi:hypothetical protein
LTNSAANNSLQKSRIHHNFHEEKEQWEKYSEPAIIVAINQAAKKRWLEMMQ